MPKKTANKQTTVEEKVVVEDNIDIGALQICYNELRRVEYVGNPLDNVTEDMTADELNELFKKFNYEYLCYRKLILQAETQQAIIVTALADVQQLWKSINENKHNNNNNSTDTPKDNKPCDNEDKSGSNEDDQNCESNTDNDNNCENVEDNEDIGSENEEENENENEDEDEDENEDEDEDEDDVEEKKSVEVKKNRGTPTAKPSVKSSVSKPVSKAPPKIIPVKTTPRVNEDKTKKVVPVTKPPIKQVPTTIKAATPVKTTPIVKQQFAQVVKPKVVQKQVDEPVKKSVPIKGGTSRRGGK